MSRSKEVAQKEHLTFKALVEEGLRLAIEKHARKTDADITPVTFRGEGLNPAFRDASWKGIRDAAYEGRGS